MDVGEESRAAFGRRVDEHDPILVLTGGHDACICVFCPEHVLRSESFELPPVHCPGVVLVVAGHQDIFGSQKHGSKPNSDNVRDQVTDCPIAERDIDLKGAVPSFSSEEVDDERGEAGEVQAGAL